MSQLIETARQYLDPLNGLLPLYERYLSKYTDTKGKRITIGVAIALTLFCHKLYRWTVPPKHFRGLPYISLWQTMKHFMYLGSSTDEMFHTLSRPLIRTGNGIYLRWDASDWIVSVANPEAAKQVFMKSDLFPKYDVAHWEGSYFIKFSGHSNILLTNGDEWKKHRMIAGPAFKRAQPVKLFNEMAQLVSKVLEREHASDTFIVDDFGNLMERLSLDIIGRAGFGFDFGSVLDKNSEWKVVNDAVDRHMQNPLFFFFPVLERKYLWLFPGRQEAHRLLDRFLGMLRGVVEHKRKVLREKQENHIEEAEKDLLTLMIESELRGEGALTDKELMGDLTIFFIAGHDTTSFALSAAIYYLAKYPDIQEKARQEIINVLCDNGEEPKRDIEITDNHIKKFAYLNQIIKETLRINGSVVNLITPRVATEDTYLSDVFIPKGTLVDVNMYDLHHNPTVWDDPETFNPGRFAPGGEADQKAHSGFYWTPFSNGSRVCIGQNFSLVEQRVILAYFLRRYVVTLPADSLHKEKILTGNTPIMKTKKLGIKFHRRF